ncbi:MAG: HAMP domain-containing sensor histidine kinase [Nitrosospira sp.]
MAAEEYPSGLCNVPWISGWRLAAFLVGTVVMVAVVSSLYEFWLEGLLYRLFRWPYDDTVGDHIRFVAQATALVGVAIIGPATLLFRSVDQLSRSTMYLKLALQVAQKEEVAAQAANVAKSRFLANMSHELRTPLNAIIGFADLMGCESFGPLLPRYRGYAGDIAKAGLHLLHVINDVLDISKADVTALPLYISDVDLGEVLTEVQVLTAGLAESAMVALRVQQVRNHDPMFVRADRVRLKQALINLVSNGIKFNNLGGSVSVRTFTEASRTCVEIRDTGIGMASDQIYRAFQPFVQLDAGHSRKYEGTGLGLSLTKMLIEAMKGSIIVESELEVGSCITITLPTVVLADLTRAA